MKGWALRYSSPCSWGNGAQTQKRKPQPQQTRSLHPKLALPFLELLEAFPGQVAELQLGNLEARTGWAEMGVLMGYGGCLIIMTISVTRCACAAAAATKADGTTVLMRAAFKAYSVVLTFCGLPCRKRKQKLSLVAGPSGLAR